VAGFLGSPRMNFLPGMLAGEEGPAVHVRLAGGTLVDVGADATRAPPGSAVTLGVRPEHLRVEESVGGDGAAGFPATVALVEYLGDSTIVYAQVDGVAEMVSLKCRPEELCPEAGERVMLGFDPVRGHLFDADGAALPRAAAAT
jgi:multiple sugar transport system ATP-binding protein